MANKHIAPPMPVVRRHLYRHLNEALNVDVDKIDTRRIMPADVQATYTDKLLDPSEIIPW